MDDRWRLISKLFHSALEREEGERASYLRDACLGDETLRHEVESLLRRESIPTRLLSTPAVDVEIARPQSHIRPLPIDTWGQFTLIERIGSGGFGDVYRARDTKLDRDIALKLLPFPVPSNAIDLLREARMLARIRHPHVVTVFGADQIDDQVGIWMEYVRGCTLEHLVRTQGAFGAYEAALIGLNLCAALAAVHGAGLLHGDIKTRNVMREEGGRLLLMDFGAGKDLLSYGERLVGTPLYMAPELFNGQERTKQVDVYALGVLLYYLVSRSYPIDGSNLGVIIEAHHRRERRYLRDLRPELPQAFVRIVEQAIAPNPDDRITSAAAFEEELGTFLGDHDNDRQRRYRPSKRHSESLESAERERRTTHLELRPTAHFVGREHDLERIHQMLDVSSGGSLTAGNVVAITALGGTGKTTLARMYAERYWAEYVQLLWIDARRGYESELARLCEIVLPDIADSLREISDRDKAQRVLSELENLKGARLLVIDNAEDEAAITRWLPKTGEVRTLVTSRYAHWEAISTYPLTVLDPSAARDLLLVRSGRASADLMPDDERAACEEIAQRLGYLPLALEQAAAYIRKQSLGFGLQDYLRLLGDAQTELLSLPVRGTTEYPASVFTTWRTTIEKLTAGARVMLRCAAFLSPTEIPLGIFHESAGELSQLESEFQTREPSDAVSTEFRVRAWRQALAEYSLITLTAGDTFAIHPLLQAVERDQIDPAERRRWVGILMDAFVRYAPPDPDRMEHWPIWRGLAAQAEALCSRGQEVGLQSANTKLLRSLCTFHSERGRFADGLLWGRKAMEQDEASLGLTHLESLSSAYSVAVGLALQGNAEAAAPIFRRVLRGRQQQLGFDAPDTIRALQWLGNVMSWQGNQTEAEPLQQRALAEFERCNPESPDTLWSLWSLGCSRADAPAGEPLLRRAVAAQLRLHGPDYVPTLVYSVSLSDCLSRQGKHAEAEALARRAASGLERIAGPDYRWTWSAIHNVADCLIRRGDFSSAEPIARRALELGGHTENPRNLWRFTRTLAWILEQQGKFDEAEPLYRGVIESVNAKLGTDSRQAQRAREDWDRCRAMIQPQSDST